VFQGGVEPILAYMLSYIKNIELQIEAYKFIQRLTARCEFGRQRVGELGGITIILDGIKLHQSHEIQHFGCLALGNIVSNFTPNKEKLFTQGGIETILDIMKNNAGDHTIQWAASLAIGNTIATNEEIKERVVKLGGIDLILKALELTITQIHQKLQERACRALLNLAFSSVETRVIIASLGGVELVFNSSKPYIDYPKNQQYSLKTLERIGHQNESNQKILKQIGIYEQLEVIRSKHATQPKVMDQVKILFNELEYRNCNA